MPIRVGDTVELVRFGTRASVLAINKDGSYLLQAGIMKVTAQPDEVYLIEETKQQAKKIIERSQRAFRSAAPQRSWTCAACRLTRPLLRWISSSITP